MGLEELRRAVEADPTLENLTALRDALAEALRALDAAAGGAELRDEQAQQWEALTEEHRATQERITTEERAARVRESRQRWQSTQFGSRVEPFDGSDVRTLGAQQVRDRALKAVDRNDPGAEHLSDEARAQVQRIVRTHNGDLNGVHIAQRLLLTENEHYREAFMRLATQVQPVLSPEQARAVQAFQEWRAMSIGTDSSGGFGVPVLIDPTIILTAQGHPNDILGLARVETITNDQWKGVTSAGVTWKFRGEATAVTDGSSTLAQPSVPVHRADGYIPYSIEFGMDYPNAAGEMQMLLSDGYAELLVDKLTTGSGSDQPTGIITALDANTNVEVALDTAGEVHAVDLNDLWAALPIRYRNPANSASQAWMSATDFNGRVQELGTDAGSAFTVNFTAEGVTVLKGRRMFENDYFDDFSGSTTGDNLAVIGDWRNFLVAQRAGMSIELVPHVFDVTNNHPTGERAWFAWARVGSDSINDLAFRLLQQA